MVQDLKIVIGGDIHLIEKSPYDLQDESRLQRKIMNLGSMVGKAIAGNVNYLVLLGDVFDMTEPNAYIRALFVAQIKRAIDHGIKVRILVGNHDSNKHRFALAPEAEIWPEVIIKTPVREEMGPMTLLFIPYMKELEWETGDAPPKKTILFGHFGIMGAKMDNGMVNTKEGMDRSLLKDLKHCYLGHYHTPQSSDNYTYPGVLARTKFSEMGFIPSFITLTLGIENNELVSWNSIVSNLEDIGFHEFEFIQDSVEAQESILHEPMGVGVYRYILEGNRTWIIKVSTWLKGYENGKRKIIIKGKVTDRKIQVSPIASDLNWDNAIEKISEEGKSGYKETGDNIIQEAKNESN